MARWHSAPARTLHKVVVLRCSLAEAAASAHFQGQGFWRADARGRSGHGNGTYSPRARINHHGDVDYFAMPTPWLGTLLL